jgi:hypothetical protein
MSAVNHTRVALDLNEATQTLWPDGVKFDSLLLLVADAYPNMKKPAKGLLVSYPKLILVKRIAHSACFVRM